MTPCFSDQKKFILNSSFWFTKCCAKKNCCNLLWLWWHIFKGPYCPLILRSPPPWISCHNHCMTSHWWSQIKTFKQLNTWVKVKLVNTFLINIKSINSWLPCHFCSNQWILYINRCFLMHFYMRIQIKIFVLIFEVVWPPLPWGQTFWDFGVFGFLVVIIWWF